MLGYPPTPPRLARRLTARPADPQGLGQPRGGGPPPPPPLGGGWGPPPPPPHSPPNCRTPLGVTHWLAAAPVQHTYLNVISVMWRSFWGVYRWSGMDGGLRGRNLEKFSTTELHQFLPWCSRSDCAFCPSLLLQFRFHNNVVGDFGHIWFAFRRSQLLYAIREMTATIQQPQGNNSNPSGSMLEQPVGMFFKQFPRLCHNWYQIFSAVNFA